MFPPYSSAPMWKKFMNNPSLYHALQKESAKNNIRFHMPGHAGRVPPYPFHNWYGIDYTEIYNTGNLYEGSKPISYAEQAAAEYFGCPECLLVTGGSTQGICAALMVAVPVGGHLLVDRNCHRSVIHGMALLDLTPHYLLPENLEPFGISGQLNPALVEQELIQHPEIHALFVTSPNYYGVCLNLSALAHICHRHHKILIVDQAHGAHFPAIGLPDAVEEGADLAIVSAHKTLPCLGQSAFLLSSGRFSPDLLRHALSVFGTSSPSYLIMASMDQTVHWLLSTHGEAYRETAKRAIKLRQNILSFTDYSVLLPENCGHLDSCRLTVCCAGRNITGITLSHILYERFHISCEMADHRNIVCILTSSHTQTDLDMLLHALSQIHTKPNLQTPLSAPKFLPPQRISVRQAFFATTEKRTPEQALGCICARPVTPYPPGVPVICPGEEITRPQIEFLQKSCYNFGKEIDVVRKEVMP